MMETFANAAFAFFVVMLLIIVFDIPAVEWLVRTVRRRREGETEDSPGSE